MNITVEQVLEALSTVSYPDAGKSLVEMDMIRDILIEGRNVKFTLVLPSFNNPFKNSLKKASEATLKYKLGDDISVQIEITSKVNTKPLETKENSILPGVKNMIAIASGKGGVGKSTIAANLAVALAKTGAKVGLLDADIYGPSVPKMFNMEGERPGIIKRNGKDIIVPVENYGVKMLSIGFFVNNDDALMWRGSMATGALQQLIKDADWGELDYFLIDLPPGTGDIHLTMVQTIGVTGAVIVSTPQDVALADVVKGISMFTNDKVNVPVLGLVENMAWFTPEELPENKYYIFGKDGVKKLAEERDMKLLGQIPIVQSIREDGDNGTPSALNENSVQGNAFKELAANFIKSLEVRNAALSVTAKVEMQEGSGCSTN